MLSSSHINYYIPLRFQNKRGNAQQSFDIAEKSTNYQNLLSILKTTVGMPFYKIKAEWHTLFPFKNKPDTDWHLAKSSQVSDWCLALKNRSTGWTRRGD